MYFQICGLLLAVEDTVQKTLLYKPIVFIVFLVLLCLFCVHCFFYTKSRSVAILCSNFTLHKKYLLSFPSFVIGCKALAQFSLTVSFWSVGLWHKEIESSPSSEDDSGIVSYKISHVKILLVTLQPCYTLFI